MNKETNNGGSLKYPQNNTIGSKHFKYMASIIGNIGAQFEQLQSWVIPLVFDWVSVSLGLR